MRPKGISYHTPIPLRLNTNLAPTDCLWHLSRFWVSDDRIVPDAEAAVQEYWASNPPATTPASSWEAFKFHAKDHYQFAIGRTQSHTGLALIQAEQRAIALEAQYTVNRDEATRADLQCAMQEVTIL